jgi:alpha-L-rhamnosidase
MEHARMITAEAGCRRALLLSTVVRLDRPRAEVSAARLRATAHGVYEARIDGRPVSDAVLSPGWTSYEWRLQVQEYDVTDLADDGALLEVLLGNGW